MIERLRPIVTSAICDACGKPMPFRGIGVEHGALENGFGYDTPELDQVAVRGRSKACLCKTCYLQACAAVGLDPCTLLRVNQREPKP